MAISRFNLGIVIIAPFFDVSHIMLVSIGIINETICWSLIGLFPRAMFLLRARSAEHTPAYILNGMFVFASLLISTQIVPDMVTDGVL